MIGISCTRCSRMIILDPCTLKSNNLNPYCIDCQKINRDEKIKSIIKYKWFKKIQIKSIIKYKWFKKLQKIFMN